MQKAEQAIIAGRSPTKADLDRALLELFEQVLVECEKWMATRPPYLHARTYESHEEFSADHERLLDDYMHPEFLRQQWQDRMKNADFGEAIDRLGPILSSHGLQFDPASTEFKVLCARGMRIGIEAFSQFLRSYNDHELDDGLKALIERRQESISPAAFHRQEPEAHHIAPKPSGKAEAPLLSSFKKAFVEQAVKEGRWTNQTKAQNSIDLLVRIVGDKQLNELKRADAEKLRRTLEQIPQNFGKSQKHRNMPIERVIANRKKEDRTLSRGTLDRHWNTNQPPG